MKYIVLSILFTLCCVQVQQISAQNAILVHNSEELQQAISNAKPGDHIKLANGVWNDVQIKVSASGTKEQPIKLSAESPGKVSLQGKSNLALGGDYIIIEGLYFVNGFSPSRAVIHFAVEDQVANHCIVTNCVIDSYNKMQRNYPDLWISLQGRHNQIDHCYLTGKSNRGPTIRVGLAGNQNINNHHKIVHNHFGPRPPKGGPSAETIQIGNSHTSMCPSYTLIANNLFDRCNGEVEIISSKTNFNEFRNNVFYKSEGSLVTRHGNYCTVDGNYFIGDESSNKEGGVRLIGTGHTVTNNYFYNLKGKEFRSPIAVMNGIPKSPLNRYIQVTDVIVAHNTFVDCVAPLQFGVGSNVSQADVLPASEIRSARPIRTTVANNVIYNRSADKSPIVAHDKLDGILFKQNIINNQGVNFENQDGLKPMSFELIEMQESIFVPSDDFPNEKAYAGFGFDQFNKDIFGTSRSERNAVGAMIEKPKADLMMFDRSQYGTSWYKVDAMKKAPATHRINQKQNLADVIAEASPGDVIELEAGNYRITSSLKINKAVTIKAAAPNAKVDLKYAGPEQTACFEMNPNGKLTLMGISVRGDKSHYAFASLKENMSSLYNLHLDQCTIQNFDYILKAYKYSFAEFITFSKSIFRNCNNGIELSEEIEDKGEYNAENISIDGCTFKGIAANVVDYYRGGYDESTVGGDLSITNSSFSNCGEQEENGILINTYGIINVNISDNVFKNNEVERVAQLWGAKNNRHANNEVINSGKIVVEENLKLKTFY